MTVFSKDDFEGEQTAKCISCEAKLDKWINVVPFGDLCPRCAQNTMRIFSGFD